MVSRRAAAVLGIILILQSAPMDGFGGQASSAVPQKDDSDWWSMTRSAETTEIGRIQHRETASANLRIVGIN